MTVVKRTVCEDAKQKLEGEAIPLTDSLEVEVCLASYSILPHLLMLGSVPGSSQVESGGIITLLCADASASSFYRR